MVGFWFFLLFTNSMTFSHLIKQYLKNLWKWHKMYFNKHQTEICFKCLHNMKGMLSLETSPREVLPDHLQSPRTQTEHKGSMSKANHDARYKRLQFLHRTSDKKKVKYSNFSPSISSLSYFDQGCM